MLSVVRPGLLTTVQDGGRPRWQDQGISAGGAMDIAALHWANRLVGNADDAAVLEITLAGPELLLHEGHWLAFAGGLANITTDDSPLPCGCPVWLPAGSRLRIGAVTLGCRSYLALAGGIDVPLCLDSRATALRAGFGGLHGRALVAGDTIMTLPAELPDPVNACAGRWPRWTLRPALHQAHSPERLRLVPGCELPRPCLQALLEQTCRVSPQSDRMGLCLQGLPIERPASDGRLTAGLAFGSVQLPPDGQPIVLGADRQSTGGYPLLGTVASADHSRLAQLRPGANLRFAAITVGEAQQLLRRQQQLDARASCLLGHRLRELGQA